MSNKFEKINREESNKKSNIAKVSAKKALVVTLIVMLIFIILLGRVAWLQFVEGEWLKKKEYSQ